jgi:hypothetical protein
MYGDAPACVFLVCSNPGAGGDDALHKWYDEVHGPDALDNGSFDALHRYIAVGDYAARFLAVWEGRFTSMRDASAYISPRAAELRRAGRVTDDMTVVWAAMRFRSAVALVDPDAPVRTLTLVRGDTTSLPPVKGAAYRYGDLVLVEHGDEPVAVQRAWSSVGNEGLAPEPYRPVFDLAADDHIESLPVEGTWVSHWAPIGSLRAESLRR